MAKCSKTKFHFSLASHHLRSIVLSLPKDNHVRQHNGTATAWTTILPCRCCVRRKRERRTLGSGASVDQLVANHDSQVKRAFLGEFTVNRAVHPTGVRIYIQG